MLRGLAVASVLLAVLVVGFVLFLQTGTGRETVRSLAVGQIQDLLADDATVSVERLDGNVLTGARLTGVRIERRGEPVLTADTVQVDYTLRTLLDRTFSASRLVVAGPTVTMRQYADSTFNVTGLFVQDPERDTTRAGIDVLIDELAVTRGRAEVHFLNTERDSVLVVRDLDARLSDLAITQDDLTADIAALALTAVATDGATTLAVTGSGAFSKEQVQLRELRVVGSEGTRLAGDARYVFEGDAFPVFDADLETVPLALADVRAFAPVPVYGDPRLSLTADSDGRQVRFALRGVIPSERGADATVVLDGALSRRSPGGPLRTQAEGSVRRFDPSQLTRNPALEADLTGDLSVDVAGTTLETLSGPFSVDLRETTAAGRRIDRLALDGRIVDGLVRFDLDGALPGLDFVAQGQARPFERVPTVDVVGTARDVDLAALVPGQRGRFAGTFAVEGRGTSLETLVGTAAVSLSRAEVPLGDRTLRLTRAELDADVRGGDVSFDADVTLAGGGGRLAASGATTLGADPLVYRIDRGRVDGLDLAVLTGDPGQRSSLTGTFSLEGRGIDPERVVADVEVALARSRYGEIAIRSARLDGSLRGGRAAFDLAADLGRAGALTAVGTARPFADPLAYSAQGRVRNLNLAVLTQNPDQVSDLSGAYSVTGRGLDVETLTADARVQLDASTYGVRRIDGADVRLALDRGELSLTGDVSVPEGQFALDVSGRPFDADPTISLGERTCFGGVDVGRLTETPTLSTDLNGCFAGSVRGLRDIETLDADGVLTLSRSRVNDAALTSGRIDLALAGGSLDADGTVRTEGGDRLAPESAGPVVTPEGELTFSLTGRPLDEVPTYALDARARSLDVSALAGLGDDEPIVLSATVALRGRGVDPATADVTGRVRSSPSRAVGVAIDTLATDFALTRGVLALDTLVVRTDLATAQAGGTLALFDATAASDFRLRADVVSLAPLGRFLPQDQALGVQSGALDLHVTGGADGAPLAVTGTADARQVVYGETAVTGIEAVLDAAVDRSRLDSLGLAAVGGTLVSRFDVLATPRLTVQEGTVEAVLRDGELAVDAGVIVDGRRDLDVAARLELDGGTGVTIDAGRFALDGDEWTLVNEAHVAVDAGRITIDAVRLVGDEPGEDITVDGTIDFSGEQDLRASITGLDVAGLTDLVGLGGLGGTLGATLTLVGPAPSPRFDARVTLDDLSSRGQAFGALDIALDYTLGTLGVDAELTHVDGQTLTAEGTVPLRFALADGGARVSRATTDADVALSAHADAFPVGWARPFLDDRTFDALDGALTLDLEIGGTQRAPALSGRADLSGGRLGVVATGLVYEPIAASVAFTDDRIVIERLTIGPPEAPGVLVTGDVTLAELSVGELDLTVEPRRFLAMDTYTFQGVRLAAGRRPLRLTGTLTAPVLSGDVRLDAGDIYVTEQLGGGNQGRVSLSEQDIEELRTEYGYTITARDTTESVFFDALAYDIDVTIDRDVWLRSASTSLGFAIEFEGAVQARKAAFAESSRLFGQIDLVRGYVETLDRRFQIDRGTLVFNGDPLLVNVDLVASTDVRLSNSLAGRSAVEITLAATGEVTNDPEIRFTSDPSLPPGDIASLLVTGRLANDAASLAGGLGVGTSLLLGSSTALLEGAIGENVGLDLVEIATDASGTLVIRLGKYLTSRAFLSGSIPISQEDTNSPDRGAGLQATLEYQIRRWLLAQGEFGGQRGVGGGVQTDITF